MTGVAIARLTRSVHCAPQLSQGVFHGTIRVLVATSHNSIDVPCERVGARQQDVNGFL